MEIEQDHWKIDADNDLESNGLGPCVGVVVGYKNRVSMLHAPMPNVSSAMSFFDELDVAIPRLERAALHPILTGAHFSADDVVNGEIVRTRKWVEDTLCDSGFGDPFVCWGEGGLDGWQNLATCIQQGFVRIDAENCKMTLYSKVIPLW